MTGRPNAGQMLVAALTASGFTVAGHGRGHVRMVWPGSDPGRGGLLVPTDGTAPEFQEALDAVKAQLLAGARRGEAARQALDLHVLEVSG
ncbi:hypothetical protein ABZY58_11930 [Micromonospora tulbaghiae]|uniref:hypothetical protein n=1 Tax=Micromonospora tulbaghiae TaxID=479978 RepID=UPI0033AA0522